MTVSNTITQPVLRPSSRKNFTFQIDPYEGCGHLCHYCFVQDTAENAPPP